MWSAACFHSTADTCADGTVCAPGLRCAAGGGCYDPLACTTDGTRCGSNGTCSGGACIEAQCGDGMVEGDEQCDDGNFVSHDGCSSRCAAETISCKTIAAPLPATVVDQDQLFIEAASGRVLLLRSANTYVLTQGQWMLAGGAPPIMRYSYRVASTRGGALRFGGSDYSQLTFYDETWWWDGTAWTQLAPSTSPPPRIDPAMADLHGRVVLYGGSDGGSTALADTWLWDGTTWAPGPTSGPIARIAPTLGYDAMHDRVQLIGGSDANGIYDTWTFDGTAWTRGPDVTTGHLMASLVYDAARGRMVIAGGRGDSGGAGPFQEWDGTTLQTLSSGSCDAIQQTLTNSAIAAYDPLGRQTIVYDPFQPTNTLTIGMRWEHDGELDESCIAGQDQDGDGLAGCADPDCWMYCAPSCPPNAPCDPAAPHCGDGICNAALETSACPQDCP